MELNFPSSPIPEKEARRTREAVSGPTAQRSWAQNSTLALAAALIENQQKAVTESAAQINSLRQEIQSLKCKRDQCDELNFDWKRKGNKKQFEFNASIQHNVEDIATSDTLLEARTFAEGGLCSIKERNKLIKIADQYGWDTANCYTSDPLASDEADNKKLRKAVKDSSGQRYSKGDKCHV